MVLWIIAGLFLMILYHLVQGDRDQSQYQSVVFSTFLNDVEKGAVKTVDIQGSHIKGQLQDGHSFVTVAPNYPNLFEKMHDKGIEIAVHAPDEGHSPLLQILISWFPMILLAGIWIFFLRQMQSGNNRAMGFGKSGARMLNEKATRIMFTDVAGCDEAKEEVVEIVEYLKDPQKFQKLGGKIPKGVLLVGSPGTGKTLLARAIVGEANVPFFTISGSEFVEMFVGVGSSRVRDLFKQAKTNAPCIIFIDEIDAVGRHRGAGIGGGNDEREQTLNQLLVEMDGFETNEGVILIAATNRPDVLDPALLRPGRFDRQVVVPMPDIKGRAAILKVHMAKVPCAADVDAHIIARGTPGFSGADLGNLVNEAALLAARRNQRVVMMRDFEEAKDKVIMGPERRTMVMTDEEKKLTAYHEAGHAVIAYHTLASDPIHKATIIPRGRALGMVVRIPENDRLSMPRDKLHGDLAVAMGGRLAEEIIFGDEKVTTGASSDIRHVTDIARRMVTEWGMSHKLGFLAYSEPQQEVFLGHSMSQQKNISEKTAAVIDQEVRFIVDGAYEQAKKILTVHLKHLHLLAKALLEYETLTGDEIRTLLKSGKFTRSVTPDVKPKTPRSSTARRKPTALTPETQV